MLTAGEITIRMQAQSSNFLTTLVSSRPQYIPRLFVGKPIGYMLNAVPLLFNVCRAAQSVAAVRASEQALGITTSVEIESYRERLVRLEMLHEHLWKLLIDLPPQLGLSPWQQEMVLASQKLQPLMRHMQSISCRLSNTISHWCENLPTLDIDVQKNLQQLLFGDRNTWQSQEALWQGEGIVGQLLRSIKERDFAISLPWLSQPPANKRHLYQAIVEQPFAVEPEVIASTTTPIDNGPLDRMKHHPWVEGKHDSALTSRLLAIVAETERLLKHIGAPVVETDLVAAGFGVSEVETARGRLRYVMMLDEKPSAEPVLAYVQVMSPTDWHFHANGIAAKSLTFVPREPAVAAKRAELMVKLINPCVGYQIEIDHSEQEVSSYA